MIKTIMIYETGDGTRFDDPNKAARYDSLIRELANLEFRLLGPRVTASDFSNGGGYVPHDPASVRRYKGAVLRVAQGWVDHPMLKEDPDTINPMGIIGRIIEDYQIPRLYSAWQRLMCIDSAAREWGQPYFALNPNAGTQVVFSAPSATIPPEGGTTNAGTKDAALR